MISPNFFSDSAMAVSEVKPSCVTKGRYKYVHDLKIGVPEAIDVHHIFISRSGRGALLCCVYFLLLAFLCFSVLLSSQDMTSVIRLLTPDQPIAIVIWSIALAGILVRKSLGKQIEKESVFIFPAFGVQLETIYRSGRTVRRFVPIDKILKPVLNECVTPITCYWTLSLILRGEEDLLLVFKGLYPPVSMLVPIWKALCAAIDNKECTDTHSE